MTIMDEYITHITVENANTWWNALPDITKLAIYEDLMNILDGERTAG